MASELQTQDREIDRNPTAASVSSTLTKELEKDVNNGYAFRFKLPSDGLALRSVAIVDGAPELRFAASPKVPTITEEDMAVAIRLASEGKRPEFFYVDIPFGLPFFGRLYKLYVPQWLRGTSVGNLLADADWNMKCLHIGARAKDHESPFSAWQETSNLDNLATCLDFPAEKPSGSLKLSCKHATVERTENELVFPNDPVMQIIADTSSTYTKYITEMYPSVAYHDEPLFLKMQELIKLVLAAEWLVDEKAVKISREWMMRYSTPKQKGAVAVAKSLRSKAKRPPREFVPPPTVVYRPSSDVTVKTVTAERYRHYGQGRYYGWHDKGSQELVMFTAKGELQMSRKWEEGGSLRITSQFPSNTTSLNYDDDVLRALPDGIKEVKFDTDSLELKCKIQPAPLLFLPEREITARVTVQNYDMLYADLDPNDSHWVGNCEVPNVESWNELHKETIPIPYCWQAPYPGSEAYTATGGVTTRDFPVRNTAEREIPTKESQWVESDQYKKRSGTQLAVKAKLLADQGNIRCAYQWEFAQVSRKFNTAWAVEKGACPKVRHVLVITNETLEMRWSAYRESLSNQSVEEHYHGTELKCRITESMRLCTNGSCGVCGISSTGLDTQYIQKNIAFQRFGNGFYLAPNSSKCHDYTQGCLGYDFRAMLLCDVCPGKKYALERKDQRLTGPPHGFNSVYGVVGRELNYPELVVYQPDAVMPRYIILYKKDGVQHLLAK